SIFVQIGDENVHIARSLLDEVFGAENACGMVCFSTTGGQSSDLLPSVFDYILWYARDRAQVKYRQLYNLKTVGGDGASKYTSVLLPDSRSRPLSAEEKSDPALLPEGARVYRLDTLISTGSRTGTTVRYQFRGREYHPGANNH